VHPTQAIEIFGNVSTPFGRLGPSVDFEIKFYGDVLLYRPALKLQKRAMKELRAMFETTSYFDSEQITSILMVSPITT